jgi:hypothetical protein
LHAPYDKLSATGGAMSIHALPALVTPMIK